MSPAIDAPCRGHAASMGRVALALAAWGFAPIARAQPNANHAVVTLLNVACETAPAETTELLGMLQVELAPIEVESVELRTDQELPQTDTGVLWLHACADEAPRIGTVKDAVLVQQRVDLSDVPATARARTLALALAELYRSSMRDEQ